MLCVKLGTVFRVTRPHEQCPLNVCFYKHEHNVVLKNDYKYCKNIGECS